MRYLLPLSPQESKLRGLKVRSPDRASFLETDVGVSTLLLLRIIEGASSNGIDWRRCIKLLKNPIEHMLSKRSDNDDGCEVLYGRAGFLYALLLIRSTRRRCRADSTDSESLPFPDELQESLERLTSDDNIRTIVEAIIDIGREGAREYAADIAGRGLMIPPLMWVWHGKRYLGAAHGVAGILQMLWNCPSHIVLPYMTDMAGTLMWLVGQQDKSGSWPTKAPSTREIEDNELVQYVLRLIETLSLMCLTSDVRTDGVMALPELSFYYPQSSDDHFPFRNVFQ